MHKKKSTKESFQYIFQVFSTCGYQYVNYISRTSWWYSTPGFKTVFQEFFSPSGDKHSRRTVPLRCYFAVVSVRFFISWQLHGCWKRGEFQPAEHHTQLAEALRDHDVSF